METDLSRRKEDWAELNKIDLEQFYKLRLYEQKQFAMGNPGCSPIAMFDKPCKGYNARYCCGTLSV